MEELRGLLVLRWAMILSIKNPTLEYSIALYKNYFVAATVDDIVLNKKPRLKFVRLMSRLSPVIDNYN